MKIPKEVIKEYVKSENFTNTTDIMESIKLVLCQDNGHIKPLFFGKISKMHKVVAFIPRFA